MYINETMVSTDHTGNFPSATDGKASSSHVFQLSRRDMSTNIKTRPATYNNITVAVAATTLATHVMLLLAVAAVAAPVVKAVVVTTIIIDVITPIFRCA